MQAQAVEGHINNNNNDNDDNRIQVEMVPLTVPVSSEDAEKMELLEEELDLAVGIKELVEADPTIDNLTDFQYAQFAIVELAEMDAGLVDVEKIGQRIQQLQEIKQEYKIVDTYEFGARVIQKALDLYGGHFLGFSYNFEGENYVMVVDQSQRPSYKELKAQTEGLNLRLQEMYFINHVMCPDFQSLRNGYIIISECGNVTSKEHTTSLSLLRDMIHMTNVYPNNLVKVKNYHAGMFSNLFYSLVKRIDPKLKSVIEVGLTFEGGPLDKIYLTPTPEAARKRLETRIDHTLKKRYQHEAEFKLG